VPGGARIRAVAPADVARIPVQSAEPPARQLSRVSSVLQRCGGGGCPAGGCGHDDEKVVRRQAAGPVPGPATTGIPAAVHDIARSPGRALAPAVRELMEPRFGHDFGHVRIHTDAAAGRAARAVGARAYTVGRDVVFGDGQFIPDSAAGLRLIAHELAHVVQQGAGAGRAVAQPQAVSNPSDAAEQEADRAADAALAAPAQAGRADLAGDGQASQDGRAGQAADSPASQDGQAQVSARIGQRVARTIQRQVCTPAPGTEVAPGLTLSGFDQRSPILPGSGWSPLLSLAGRITSAGQSGEVRVHGYASEEGDPGFNAELSCARASGVRDVCQANGVRNPISLFAHGGTDALGTRREDNRAVIVTEPAAPGPTPQQDEQKPDQQEPPPQQQQQGTPPPVSCTPDSGCPSDYCLPFPTTKDAEDDRASKAESLLTGLPNGRARPLYREFIFGGGPFRDISADLATDFTNSVDTIATTRQLTKALEDAVKASPPAFPPGGGTVTLKISDVLSDAALRQIMAKMTFSNVMEVPGLIAGGVGTNQASCPVGAKPSSQDDDRAAEGTVTVAKNSDGSLLVSPTITYSVRDTLDFCPGNCGGPAAQILTVPLSRWEASLISGDIPFIVRFPAPSITGASHDEEE
jgi:outer membrane protein OmpA-like peptidoglycan-associated protein